MSDVQPYPLPYAQALPAILAALEPLRGLRLSTVSRAVEILTLGFGELQMVGRHERPEYALHVAAPWRLDHVQTGTVTGRADLWQPVEGERPRGWRWDQNPTLRDHLLGHLFPRNEARRRLENHSDDFRVREIGATAAGDVSLRFAGPYELRIVPDSTRIEAWRVFRPGIDDRHFVFEAGCAGYQ
jgi:hypothetical protein